MEAGAQDMASDLEKTAGLEIEVLGGRCAHQFLNLLGFIGDGHANLRIERNE